MGLERSKSVLLILGILIQFTLGSEICGKAADIAFVIDSSSSIWIYDFMKQIEFVQELVKSFDIGPDKTHISALTFSDKITVRFHLTDFENKDDIISKIGTIHHENGGATLTHSGLAAMRNDLFSSSNGARANVPHICILLTDGESTFKAATQEEAEIAREAGIRILAIGIGSKVNKGELQALVTPPAEDNFFYINNFNELKTTVFQQLVGQRACEVIFTTPATIMTTTTTEPTTTTTTTITTTTTTMKPSTTTTEYVNEEPLKTCQGKEADVVFIVDQSSSIWIEHFKQQLIFLNDVVDHFDIETGKTRVGLIKFSDQATVQFYLNEKHTKEELHKAIKGVTFEGGITNTHLALEMLQKDMFTKLHGFRPGVAHICVLITDGRSTNPELTIPQAQRVHDSGIYVFAVGVGNMTDKSELIQMASKPAKDFMFEVNGYDALKTIQNILAYKTCEVPQGDQPQCARDIQADVIFGLHGVGNGDRAKVIEFINSIGGGFDLSSGKTRIACRETCGNADFDLMEFKDGESFASSVTNSMAIGLSGLLLDMRTAFGTGTARSKADRIAILILTGEVTDMKSAYTEAMRLKSRTRVIVVGIGKDVSVDQMKQLASYKDSFVADISHVFPISDSEELPHIVKKLHVLMCKGQ